MKPLKILLATGGSGGHVFPALVTAQELKKRGHSITFAGVFRQAGAKIESAGFEYFEIHAKGFSTRSALAVIQFFFAGIRAFLESECIIKKVKPDIVVGFGGYGAFSLVLAACLQGITTMIHEQNVVVGKANRVLAFFVKRIAVGFKQAKDSLPINKVLVTGCPSRLVIKDFDYSATLKSFGFPEGIKIILVLGGSQGSQRINAEFIKAAQNLKSKMTFAVIHICGPADVDICKDAYKKLGISHWVASFTDDIFKAYSVANLAVSRAGAMTVTELAAFLLPAILIPYPYAGGHQKNNALVLTQTKASFLIDQKDLTAEVLENSLERMLRFPMSKEQIAQAYAGIYQANAAVILADEIERLKT